MSSDHHLETHGHEEAHDDGGAHGGVVFYTIVAVILCLLTGLEVAILYPPIMYLPDPIKVVILIGLSVVKFAAVVAFFMHLYFDHPLTTFLFLMGLVLAAGTMVGLVHVMPAAENPLQPIEKKKDEKPHTAQHASAPQQVQDRLQQWRLQTAG